MNPHMSPMLPTPFQRPCVVVSSTRRCRGCTAEWIRSRVRLLNTMTEAAPLQEQCPFLFLLARRFSSSPAIKLLSRDNVATMWPRDELQHGRRSSPPFSIKLSEITKNVRRETPLLMLLAHMFLFSQKKAKMTGAKDGGFYLNLGCRCE